MRVEEVIILDDAVVDLESGKAFYDEREYGIGDYFIDCIFSDLTSLASIIFNLDTTECYRNVFLLRSITTSTIALLEWWRYWICARIRIRSRKLSRSDKCPIRVNSKIV